MFDERPTPAHLRATALTTVLTATPTGAVSDTCPVLPPRACMTHRWSELTFLHWSFDPAEVQRLLPAGLTVETFDSRAWVGLVPFRMRVGLPNGASAPWVGTFLETNVRTYVRAADGTTGIWFFSLDAARFGAVAIARTTYRLPYFWSSMRLARAGDIVTYECRRRMPGPAASSTVAVEVGGRLPAAQLDDFDRWLTARFRLYRGSGPHLQATWAHHTPWPLHAARVLHCDDGLIAAAGLPAPHGDPVAHWSPGVDVTVGFPHRIRGV